MHLRFYFLSMYVALPSWLRGVPYFCNVVYAFVMYVRNSNVVYLIFNFSAPRDVVNHVVV